MILCHLRGWFLFFLYLWTKHLIFYSQRILHCKKTQIWLFQQRGVIRSSNSKDIQYNGQSQIVFSFVRVVLTVFSVELCRSLFVLLSFFFRPLYCLFFDLPCLLITLLVSSLKQYRHWETTGLVKFLNIFVWLYKMIVNVSRHRQHLGFEN